MAESPSRASEKSCEQDKMQNRGEDLRSHPVGPSEKPLDPRLSTRLELVRTILGGWAEPVLVAYGNYARHPEQRSNLEKMLQVCCDAARQITQAVGAAITVAQGPELVYVARSGELVSSIGARVNAESGFPGACVKSRRLFLSNHALTDPRVDPSVRRRGIKSLIAVPMVENGEVFGFFEVLSRNENAFNVTHIVSLQFMANLVGQALSQFRKSNQCELVRNALPGALAIKESFPAPSPAHVVGLEMAAPPLSQTATPLQHAVAGPGTKGPKVDGPLVSSSQSVPEIVEPQRTSELANRFAPASTISSTERRSQPRTSVDSLVYVSLGEENGGILLDVNDSGFSMQTAFPLDPGNPHLRRARFSGNGDFEIDCELAWDQSGQAGFRFSNLCADVRGRLRSWIAANGIVVSPLSPTVPRPERTQLAASAIAQLDELRSMLLNGNLTKEGLKK